jgi:type II secretory pathway pseudopilin PulG
VQIFIQHQGQQTGPFPLEQVQAGLAAGTYQLSDLAWHEGAAEWQPLGTIPGVSSAGPPGLPPVPQTSALAVWSLILGILSLILAGLTAIPAVICGHLALGKIKRSAGTQTGGGLAIAGLITGYLGFAILMIAILAGLTAPMIIRQKKKAAQVEAMSNARSFGLALFEFENEYGSYPNDSTAAAVAEVTETEKETGTSSNAYFRQLIRSGISQSEAAFYSAAEGSRKPDNVFDGNKALEPGECGFAYISNLKFNADAPQPIAMTPFVPGTDRFDPRPFAGKAVILWTDNSVKSLPIQSGEVMLDGQNLLDPAHPIWNGIPPVLALPE